MINLKVKKRVNKFEPVFPSRAVELWYTKKLLMLIKRVRALVWSELAEPLKEHMKLDELMRPTVDAAPPIDQWIDSILKKIGNLDDYSKRLADEAVKRNLKSSDQQLTANIKKGLGIDISKILADNLRISAEMEKSLKANAALIKSIPDEYISQVKETVKKNYMAGVRWEAMQAIILERGAVAESRAKLIARDQAAKMNSAFNRIRQTELGIEKYRWSTSGDERVRDTHRENDGNIFFWNNPPDTGHPGEDYQCRCVALPLFDIDTIETDE